MLKRHNKNSNSSREQSCSPRRKVCSAHRKTYSRKISCFSLIGACCKLSGVCLLLLTFLLINPTTTSASALEAEEDASYDDQISTQADSGVTISFTPSSGSASLTPTTSEGASAKINVSANVKIASTGGYTIYLGAKSSALTGATSKQTIPAATTATTFANMKTNTWGYAYAEGSSVPDSATYSALPQGQGISLESKSGNQTNVNKTYALSFATKIGNDRPADMYSNQITLSVTTSPMEVAKIDDFGIENMQQMTATVCSNAKDTNGDGEIATQLKDTRDGKYYWVNKLADGKCWMTQNLDLDLSTSKALTSSDSDVTSSWTPGYSTVTTVTASTILADNAGQRSWNLGDYRIINPSIASGCGLVKESLAKCTSQFTAYATPKTANGDTNAHYIAGNYYQWNAATAGTGGTITSGQAGGSVCPRGWRLPTAGSSSDYQTLSDTGAFGSDVARTTLTPYYFVRSGHIHQDSNNMFSAAGDNASYWSSSSNHSNTALAFYISGASKANSIERKFGVSVRCIAR